MARTLSAEAIYRAGVEQTVLTVLVDEPTAHLDASAYLVTRACTAWRNLAQPC